MISKCANPACLNRFLYLHTGKLFRFERHTLNQHGLCKENGDSTSEINPTQHKQGRCVEFFWLCNDCAPVMTLVYHADTGVVTQRLRKELKAS